MTVFLTLVSALLGLVGLLLILGLFTKKDYAVRRGLVIHKPAAQVYDYLRYVKNHDDFNPRVMQDPDMKTSDKGMDGTVGFVYGWNGDKNVGEGEKEITALHLGKQVDVEMRFQRPLKVVTETRYTLDAVSADDTQVSLEMRSRLNYPFNIMLIFMNVDKHLGKDFETSLAMLRDILEK